MRSYTVYRDIRKRAMIWGLPISLFALFAVSVIGSLLIVIFSFGLGTIALLLVWNAVLFISLGRIQSIRKRISIGSVFPKNISNKKDNILNHVTIEH